MAWMGTTQGGPAYGLQTEPGARCGADALCTPDPGNAAGDERELAGPRRAPSGPYKYKHRAGSRGAAAAASPKTPSRRALAVPVILMTVEWLSRHAHRRVGRKGAPPT
ncbi:hypothetical protein Adeh_3257 [Anaeromyxobacter dehalogenans 2CP-C]|uniref:Uncharacterized protein n=1 Tax=Anaeromyxobacter dehalogenans (strain 2CP-C) TaxID=290397 RepID=Q2IEL6_ANADE|nr:hypothetical protein Adeh_3257 [Anaeromyxobacter dehalogenans 2CP-C]